MKNTQETRTLFGGVDSDSAPYLIEKGMVLNVMNMRAIRSLSQNTGQLEPIAPPVLVQPVQSILANAGGTYTLVGKYADEENNKVYFCFWASAGSLIIKFDPQLNVATLIFGDAYVIGGLNWNLATQLSIRVYGDIFVFANEENDVRYLNLDTTYSTSTPISQTQLSLITEPPIAPLHVQRVTDTNTTIFTIQRKGMQFTYRVKNTENFTSVLAPYSETVLPVRESLISADIFTGNGALATVNKLQKIPQNWSQVDFIVRNLDDNTFYVIKSFNSNNPADVISVTNHNDPLNAYALNSGNYFGVTQTLIDSTAAAKEFDNVPISSKTLEIAQNRLLLGNNVEGYDAADEPPLMTVNTSAFTGIQPTLNSYQMFLVMARDTASANDQAPQYGAIFIQIGTGIDHTIWSLPLEMSRTRWNYFNHDVAVTPPDSPAALPNQVDPYYLPSQVVSKDSLVPIRKPVNWPNNGLFNIAAAGGLSAQPGFFTGFWEQLVDIVFQAHQIQIPGTATFKNDNTGIFLFDSQAFIAYNIFISDDPSEVGPSGESRAFLPSTKYSYGIRFYDDALRTCSVKEIGSITTPDYAPSSKQLMESVTFAPNTVSTTGVPPWAKYFAITMSKNNTSAQFLTFCPNLIKTSFIDNDGVITIQDDNFNKFKGKKYYGIAIPLASLSKNNLGYAYADGDFVRMSFGNITPAGGYTSESSYVYSIKTVINGYLILSDPGDTELTGPLVRMSTTYDNIQYPVLDVPTGYARVTVLGSFTERQRLCYVTIYQQPQSDYNEYEVAAFGPVSGRRMQGFFDVASNSIVSSYSVFGDCYTQKRTGNTGAFTGLSMTTNESLKNATSINKWVDIYGRIAPLDNIGQQRLTNEIRWSNVGTTQTNVNGLSSFDALDYKLLDITAGSITSMILTTREIQSGGQLVILCSNGSFTSLVGQQELYNADGQSTVNASSPQVLNVINPIKGGWGCIDPKSVCAYNGLVFWVDVRNRKIIQFSQAGADEISKYKNTRLWRQLLKRAVEQNQAGLITGGINPYSSEYIVHVPITTAVPKPVLPTTTLENPLDFYYAQQCSYAFNWDTNTWNFVWDHPTELFNLDQVVYGWDRIQRFVTTEFGGPYDTAIGRKFIVAIPFGAENYPTVYSPLSLKIDATRPPDETWVQCQDIVTSGPGIPTETIKMVSGVDGWSSREGDYATAIRKNRLSNNAATSTEWDMAGINGWSVKGKIVNVILVWYSEGPYFNISSATLSSRISSGH